LLHATRNLVFTELEIRNPVDHQAADLVIPLEHGYLMTCPVELLGCSEAGGTATDDSDSFACQHFRRIRIDPAFGPAAIDDCSFDALNRNRLIVVC
jgi:hypothetical protein